MPKLRDIHVGNVDGRYEFVLNDEDIPIEDIFLHPPFISTESFDSRATYFIYGMRGVGKTSILRWLHNKKRRANCITRFILFKSDVTEAERVNISNATGQQWIDTDKAKMEFSQDFKEAWYWFVFHAIGEMILDEASTDKQITGYTDFNRLLGLTNEGLIEKTLGWLPKLHNSKVRIKGAIPSFEAELQGDLVMKGTEGETTLVALNKRLRERIKDISTERPIHIYIDELELFRESPEQYDRDRRLIRDLVFVVSELNEFFRDHRVPITIIAAVRTEVLHAIRTMGQEVQRRVYDRGVNVHWDPFVCSLQHPILNMVRKKLRFSEKRLQGVRELRLDGSDDILLSYFPGYVSGTEIEHYLLDRSFYRPRDVVQRLSIAQQAFPDATSFSSEVLESTEQAYSKRLWEEIAYGLSAKYGEEEISIVENLFAGAEAYFYRSDIENRARRVAEWSRPGKKFFESNSAADILMDLYVFGAVGNAYFAGKGGDFKNRWIHRGDQDLFVDRRMVLHRALWRRFDASSSVERQAREAAPLETKSARAPSRRRGGRGKRSKPSGKPQGKA